MDKIPSPPSPLPDGEGESRMLCVFASTKIPGCLARTDHSDAPGLSRFGAGRSGCSSGSSGSSAPSEVGFWMRPALVELWKLDRPSEPVNDADWLRERPTVWINGRWLPAPDVRIDAGSPHIGMHERPDRLRRFAARRSAEHRGTRCLAWRVEGALAAAGGQRGDARISLGSGRSQRHGADPRWRAGSGPNTPRRPMPAQIAVIGPTESFIVAENATIEPFVFADTRGGPVLIDRGADRPLLQPPRRAVLCRSR